MSVLILLLFIVELSCLEVYYDDLTYFPKDSNDIINYRYMKLTRSRDKTLIYFRGNFTVLTDLGNQKLVVLELHNENAMMVRSVKPFCVFVKEETIFWPSLIKSSNMPKDNPCPFPAGRYRLQKFSLPFSKSLVQPLNSGKYQMNIILQENGKDLIKYEIYFTVKK
ncbi:unnamed protein product [Chironomus riparius]|uniref:Uncharacterized protein n=1 Tax=Chironomus riparius TaxID=315576 RepID=A0A9N9WV41_9DIPT|nr:unnamed protein product [Chironomus riparius]